MLEEFHERKQAANLCTLVPSRRFNSFYDDDDYEESTIPLNEIFSQIPPSIAITPVLPTLEPEDSLIMGDENLSTIPEKESDKFIKSSVEDLVPIPNHDPKNLKDEPDNKDLKNMVKVFDLEIHEKNFSPTYVNYLCGSTFLPPHIMIALDFEDSCARVALVFADLSLDPFVEIPSSESKVHIEVLSVLWGNRLPILDGSLPLSRKLCYDDDDDYDYEESSIPLRDIISEVPLSIAITPDLPTLEPEDSLIMGNKELSTIPEKESDEFIKSSVKDFVPIPSESEDTSESDSDYDLPSCDDFSPINVYEEKSVTFSNPLFDSNDDFTSSNDESLSDEDVQEDNVKIYSNPLFEYDDEYISSDINPLFDEMLEDIESEDSYVSKLDEPDFLVTSLSTFNEDECIDPGGDIDDIDVFLDIVISTDIIDGYYDSEGD
ncbi:hypothetical protein Tco_0960276, partial [Tanacetum coccineum]